MPAHAGDLLALQLRDRGYGALYPKTSTIVLGLPRGGVPVAAQISKNIQTPLDVVVSRKLGVPSSEEYAFGAIAAPDCMVMNEGVARIMGLTQRDIQNVIQKETAELNRRITKYRQGKPPLNVGGMNVILVDDGLATGATMKAALKLLKRQSPRRICVAVPVAPPDAAEELKRSGDCDEVVVFMEPPHFGAVGLYYDNFEQTEDEQVLALLGLGNKEE
ncbi:hypothetical protein SeMB42_g03896 [Synchytrium endobioticum]|uniref:Phosphoribosyltransferase domain-containing protein n=1 Tax=Synchytrium endobioticum TaxID=286115 RepID=A0A507D2H3_9FUNG|nr:hypothetical protein SeMB42_g03896 [Synchytrium endobioticum]